MPFIASECLYNANLAKKSMLCWSGDDPPSIQFVAAKIHLIDDKSFRVKSLMGPTDEMANIISPIAAHKMALASVKCISNRDI